MPETRKDLDEALLHEAQQLLDTSSAVETINQALIELISQRRHRQAAESQIRRYQAGQFAMLPGTGGRP
jgi:Arc/MetJ family transcription regulator